MAQDTDVAIVLHELHAAGLKPKVEPTGSNHRAITWCVEGKQPRTYFAANSPSDWRSRLNARAEVRRYLKADNVPLDQRKPEKPKSDLQKAISVPVHTETISETVAALRCEVADLTLLCLQISDSLSDHVRAWADFIQKFQPQPGVHHLSHHGVFEAASVAINANNFESALGPRLVVMPEPEPEPNASVAGTSKAAPKVRAKLNRVAIDAYLSARHWKNLETIIKESGIQKGVVAAKLYYLHRKGRLERDGDRYRLVRTSAVSLRKRA